MGFCDGSWNIFGGGTFGSNLVVVLSLDVICKLLVVTVCKDGLLLLNLLERFFGNLVVFFLDEVWNLGSVKV